MPASICDAPNWARVSSWNQYRLDETQATARTQHARQIGHERLQPVGVMQGVDGQHAVEHAVGEERRMHVHVHGRKDQAVFAEDPRRRQMMVDVDGDAPPAQPGETRRGPREVGTHVEHAAPRRQTEPAHHRVEGGGEPADVAEVFVVAEEGRAVVVGQRQEGGAQRAWSGQQLRKGEVGGAEWRVDRLDLEHGPALPLDGRVFVAGRGVHHAVAHGQHVAARRAHDRRGRHVKRTSGAAQAAQQCRQIVKQGFDGRGSAGPRGRRSRVFCPGTARRAKPGSAGDCTETAATLLAHAGHRSPPRPSQ